MKPTPKHIAKVKEAATEYIKARDAFLLRTHSDLNSRDLRSNYADAKKTLLKLIASRQWPSDGISNGLIITTENQSIIVGSVNTDPEIHDVYLSI